MYLFVIFKLNTATCRFTPYRISLSHLKLIHEIIHHLYLLPSVHNIPTCQEVHPTVETKPSSPCSMLHAN